MKGNKEEEDMLMHTFQTPGLSINSYLIGDSKRAAIIDPTRDLQPYIDFAKQSGLEITDIIETHVHADFVSGAKELKQELHGKPKIHCSSLGGPEWIPRYANHLVKNGDEITLGTVRLKALHTPGHTPEHLTWLCYDDARSKETPCLAFTGDFIFVGSVGRPDLLGTEETKKLARQLYHSIFDVIVSLPDSLEIFPAHGAGSLCGKGLSDRPSSTLGYERQFNPAFVKLPIDQWVSELLSEIPGAPINFQRIKKLNVIGPPDSIKGAPVIIDVRNPEQFSVSHIEGSLNVPYGSTFCNWIGSVVGEDIPIGLIADHASVFPEVVKNLKLIGFDHIVMQLVWDETRAKREFPIETLPLVNVEAIDKEIQNPKSHLYVLDVRTLEEWNSGHIKGAHHLELVHLRDNVDKVPTDVPIAVTCGRGYRGSIAASLLKQKGYRDVSNIRGGMSAWIKAKQDVEKKDEV